MLLRKRTLLAAATASAALAIPAVASAKDFCVGGPAGCSGTPVAANGLKAALTAAQANGTDDRFFLAPGTYSADAFSHQSPERVQIFGAGAGKTIVRGDVDDDWVLTLDGNPASSVSGLTIEPIGGPRGALMLLDGAAAHGVSIDAKSAGAAFAWGAALRGGAIFDHGRIDLATTQNGYALGVIDMGTVTDSTLIAHSGAGAVITVGSAATVRRSTLNAPVGAIAEGGHLTVSDSLIDVRGLGAGAGAAAMPGAAGVGTISSLDVNRTTIVGSGGKAGVLAVADSAGKDATAHVHDTVISGFATPVAREAMNGAIAARLTTDRSAYPAAATPLDVGPGKLVETHHTTASPGFVGNGDVHLTADSPLIDAGTPGSVPAGGTDRDGRARASDGNGDCAGVTDIGAFEYQGTKVRAVAAAAAPTAVARHAVTFSARGSCVPGAGVPTIRWRFDDGALAAGAAAAHAFTALGRHTATVTVTDGHGHSAQASAAVTVTARAPRISRLRVTHIGTIRFRLSKPATVTLRVAKRGHRPHKTITVKAHTGTNRARVTAKPGRYRLTATAIGTTGLRSNRATAHFTATH